MLSGNDALRFEEYVRLKHDALLRTARRLVNLSAVPADVAEIVFPVSIHDATARSQNFGQVRQAYIRVVNQNGGAERARYDLREDAATETAMVFGELYRNGSEWKFRAVGQGYASGLTGIAQDFGVSLRHRSNQPPPPAPSTRNPPPRAGGGPHRAEPASGETFQALLPAIDSYL